MIENIKESHDCNNDEYTSLKVRYGDCFNKFYLNFVEGSYDMSLQLLINFILQDSGYYKKILSKKTYKEVTNFNKSNPERLYYFADNEDEDSSVDYITWAIICAVRMRLEKYNFDTRNFISGGYESISSMPHISEYNLVENIIVFNTGFLTDLNLYISQNDLTENDISKLYNIVQESGSHVDIAKILHEKYPSISMNLLRLSIDECTKKSEFTVLYNVIKKLNNNNIDLLEEIKVLKEKF